MLKRIFGSLGQIFNNVSNVAPEAKPDLTELLSKIKNDGMTRANADYKSAIRELSSNQSIRVVQKNSELIESINKKDTKTLSVEELEQLANAYFEGNHVQKSQPKALELWQTAAEQGSFVGKFSWAQCLKDGIGVEKDSEKAFQLMSELAAKDFVQAQVRRLFFFFPCLFLYLNL
jgi:TPR repeat protein